MKLHLPKQLFTALITAITLAAPGAKGITVTNVSETVTLSGDTLSNLGYAGNLFNYTVNSETGVGTFTGIGATSFTLTFTMDNALAAGAAAAAVQTNDAGETVNQGAALVYVSSANHDWGFQLYDADGSGEESTPVIRGRWDGEYWENDTETLGFDVTSGTSSTYTATIAKSGSGGTKLYTGSSTEGTPEYDKSGLTASENIISATVNTKVITEIQVQDRNYHVSNADGTWEKELDGATTTILSGTTKFEVTNSSSVLTKKSIVVGSGTQLFLQTWYNGGTAIETSSDIYIGKTTYAEEKNDAYNGVSLRFGNDLVGGSTTTLKGNIYLVEDAKIKSGSTNTITIEGKVTDVVDGVDTGSILTVEGQGYQIAGAVQVSALELVGSNSRIDFLSGSTLQVEQTIQNAGTISLDGDVIFDSIGVENYDLVDYSYSKSADGEPGAVSGFLTINKVLLIGGTVELVSHTPEGGGQPVFTGSVSGTALESVEVVNGVGLVGTVNSETLRDNYFYVNENIQWAKAGDGTNYTATVYDDSTADAYVITTGNKLDVYGNLFAGKNFVLEEGATLQNTGAALNGEKQQFQSISLTGDAYLNSESNMGLIGSGYGATELNLNGNTLTKQGGNDFFLVNTTVNGGGTIQINSGNLQIGMDRSGGNSADVTANNTHFVLNGGTLKIQNSGNQLTAASVSGTGDVTGDGSLVLNGTGTYTLDGDFSVSMLTNSTNLTVNGTTSTTSITNTGNLVFEGAYSVGNNTLQLASGTANTSSVQFNGSVTANSISMLGSDNEGGNVLGHIKFYGDVTSASGIHARRPDITFGNGTTQGAAILGSMELGDSNTTGSTHTVTVSDGYTLAITGSTNSGGYRDLSLIIGEWNAKTTLDVSGNFLAKNATMYLGDSGGTLNINNGGTVAVQGIIRANSTKNPAFSLTLSDGGKLVLGSVGLNVEGTGSQTYTLNGGTVGISAESVALRESLVLGGEVTFDTMLYGFTTDDTELVQGQSSGTITLYGGVSGSGSIKVVGNGSLELAGTIAANNGNALAAVVGSGKVLLSTDTNLGANSTRSGGSLIVGNGGESKCTLTFGNGTSSTANISSFSQVTLDNGKLSIHSKPSEIKNLTITENGGEVYVNDTDSTDRPFGLIGTTQLDGDLTITAQYKYNILVDHLSGTGNLIINGKNSNSWENPSIVRINSLQQYEGAISFTRISSNAGAKCELIVNTGVGSQVNLAGLTLNGHATAGGVVSSLRTDVETNIASVGLTNSSSLTLSGAGALSIDSLNLAAGTTLKLEGASINAGSGAFELNGTINVTSASLLKKYGEISYTGGTVVGNGYETGSFYVIDGGNITYGDAFKLQYMGQDVVVDTTVTDKLLISVADDSRYIVNNDESVSSLTASSYYIAKTAKLTVSNSFTGTLTHDIMGDGTISLVVGSTSGHGNRFNAGSFNGVVELDKTDDGNGNVNLNTFQLGQFASFRLIRGNHWSPDGEVIVRNLELAGETVDDFRFCHDGTLKLAGKVTGTYLSAGRNYNDNAYNNLILSGAGTDIKYVNMSGGKLTINVGVSFGQVNAPNLELASGVHLVLGNDEFDSESTINSLTGKAGSQISLLENATLNSIGTLNGSVKLSGSGIYNLGSSTDAKVEGLNDAESWTGKVVLNGATNVTGLDINAYGNASSKVQLIGVTGQFSAGSDNAHEIAANVIFGNETGEAVDGFTHTNGHSDTIYTFSETVAGTGHYKNGCADGAINSTFSGDVSGWTGSYIHEGESVSHLTFAGSATTINAALTRSAGTLNLTVNTTGAATFSKNVSVSSLALNQTASFAAGLTTSGNVTIDSGKDIQLAGSNTIGGLLQGAGSIMYITADGTEVNFNGAGEHIIKDINPGSYTGITYNVKNGATLKVTGSMWMQNSSICLEDGASFNQSDNILVTGTGANSTISRQADGDTSKLTSANAAYTISNAEVEMTHSAESTLGMKLTESSLTSSGSSLLTVSNSGNTITSLAANGGNVKLDESMGVQSISAKTGKAVTVANGKTISMAGGVSLSANGADATMTAKSNSALAQLAEDASFTIQDMTLTNTTITAASVNTRVNLNNVSGDATLAKGTFGLQMQAGTPNVGLGGASLGYGVAGTPSLTLGTTDAKLVITADPSADVSGIYRDYTLTFNLNVSLDSIPQSGDDWKALVGFDGWLGTMLENQNATYQVADGAAQVSEGASAPAVSYGYAAGGGGGNVGTLVITISGLNVPEPTTSTLSLLALAALAARRRRK